MPAVVVPRVASRCSWAAMPRVASSGRRQPTSTPCRQRTLGQAPDQPPRHHACGQLLHSMQGGPPGHRPSLPPPRVASSMATGIPTYVKAMRPTTMVKAMRSALQLGGYAWSLYGQALKPLHDHLSRGHNYLSGNPDVGGAVPRVAAEVGGQPCPARPAEVGGSHTSRDQRCWRAPVPHAASEASGQPCLARPARSAENRASHGQPRSAGRHASRGRRGRRPPCSRAAEVGRQPTSTSCGRRTRGQCPANLLDTTHAAASSTQCTEVRTTINIARWQAASAWPSTITFSSVRDQATWPRHPHMRECTRPPSMVKAMPSARSL
ncbi:hypothetical protein Dimus_007230 [Dionaea muscipula]